MLHRSAFRNHLLSNPHTALHIIEALSQRLRHTTESAEELASLNVRQRVASKLLELVERCRHDAGERQPGLEPFA